jgi:hypothetical protein
MLEDARRDAAARDFAHACATLIGLVAPKDRLEPAGSAVRTAATGTPASTEAAADESGLDPALETGGTGDGSQLRAAVLVLTLPDIATPLAHQIACAAQSVAADHAIPYVKMLGTRIVAAVGFTLETSTGVKEAASRLADAAIALRERCAALLEIDDGPAAFGFGLDVGSVLGARLGEAPGLFNLWGEAVQGATALATSAPVEAIQASEQVYGLLRQSFLFRPRGLFYRPGSGERRSYVLAGRA